MSLFGCSSDVEKDYRPGKAGRTHEVKVYIGTSEKCIPENRDLQTDLDQIQNGTAGRSHSCDENHFEKSFGNIVENNFETQGQNLFENNYAARKMEK